MARPGRHAHGRGDGRSIRIPERPSAPAPAGARGSEQASAVAVEDARLGQAGQAVFHRPGPGLAHALDLLELGHRRPHDPLQSGEVLDDPVDERFGEARQAVQQAVATGLERARRDRRWRGRARARPATRRSSSSSSVDRLANVASAWSEPPSVGARPWAVARAVRRRDRPVGHTQVVAHHQPADRRRRRRRTSSSWSRSSRPSSPSSTSSTSISSAIRHSELGRLEHGDHVVHGHRVLDLECAERGHRRVESLAEPLQWSAAPGPPARAGGARRLEHVASSSRQYTVTTHGRRHRHHRHVDRPGHALRRAVARPGLDGRDRRRWA